MLYAMRREELRLKRCELLSLIHALSQLFYHFHPQQCIHRESGKK